MKHSVPSATLFGLGLDRKRVMRARSDVTMDAFFECMRYEMPNNVILSRARDQLAKILRAMRQARDYRRGKE